MLDILDQDIMYLHGVGPKRKEILSKELGINTWRDLLEYYPYKYVDRSKVYIANIVKCRPPQNRDPKPEEQEMCIDWLRTQVKLMRPKIIVCLGRISAGRIIKSDIKITKEHGLWFEKGGIQMMAMLHPAAVLRDPRRKPDAFDDFLKLRDKINEVCDHTYE